MDAYAVYHIPLPWAANVGVIALAGYLLCSRQFPKFIGMKIITCLAAFAIAVTTIKSILFSLPTGISLTVPFSAYILLRILNIISFIAAIGVVCYLLEQYKPARLMATIIMLGVVIALFSYLVYYVQTHFLSNMGQNRATSYFAQGQVIFSYPFHRAVGTFREPSLLAAWLMVPFVMSLSSIYLVPASILIGGILLLTGSLSLVLCLALGALGSLLTIIFFTVVKNKKVELSWARFLLLLTVVAVCSYGIFHMMNVSSEALLADQLQQTQQNAQLSPAQVAQEETAIKTRLIKDKMLTLASGTSWFDVIKTRISKMLHGGISAENRMYIYDYEKTLSVTWLGQGLGISNINFGVYVNDLCHSKLNSVDITILTYKSFCEQYRKNKIHPAYSFVNLYLNYLVSLGVIGLFLLIAFFIWPFYIFSRQQKTLTKEKIILLTIYIAVMASYFALLEEFTLISAIVYACFIKFCCSKES
jgi:hypothetical protein